MAPVEIARFVDLSAATLYEILALRARVFVVEQECVYLDVDGRDVEPDTLHLFAAGADAGSADAGSADAGSADAGSADAGSADAGSADAGSADAGSADAGSGCVVAYARVLREPDGTRKIGRVVAALAARGTGVAATVMREAVRQCGAAGVVLDAQAPLAGWYAGFGFAVDGEEFLEDGIPHVPMRLQH